MKSHSKLSQLQLLRSGYFSSLVTMTENLNKYSCYHDNKSEKCDGSDAGGSHYDDNDEKVRPK